MKYILTLGSLYMLITTTVVAQVRIPNLNCTLIEPEVITVPVNFGWPVDLSCNVFEDLSYNYYYYDIEEHGSQCLLWDSETGQLLFNKTASNHFDLVEVSYRIPDFSLNSSVLYEFNFILNGNCKKLKVFINATEQIEKTCSQAVELIPVLEDKATIGSLYNIFCQGTVNDFTIKWYRNCGNLTSDLIERGNQLTFSPVTKEHVGLYTCAYVYNGMTQYLASTKLCLRPSNLLGKLTMLCTQNKYFSDIGDTVILQCSVNLGTGRNSLIGFASSWVQLTSQDMSANLTTCVNLKDETESVQNNRINCSWFLNQSMEIPCFESVPTEDDIIASASVVTLRFLISDVRASDFGKYSLTFRANSESLVTDNLTLQHDVRPSLTAKAEIVGICIAILVLLIIFMAVIYIKLFYVRLFLKRKFGAFERDNKKYGAFLSYQYSKTEIDTFAQQVTKNAVIKTSSVLKHMGYSVFDENHDGGEDLGSSRAENCINVMSKSHRVIVFMSTQYISNHWSVYTLQKALEHMIEARLPIIFIMLPGVKEYLKQHSKKDATCRTIKNLIKLNYAIYYSDDKKFDTSLFELKLEYAMPKILRHNKDVELQSPVNTHILIDQSLKNGYTNSANCKI